MICQRSLRNVCIYLCIHSPLTQAHTYRLHMQVAEERSCRGGHFYEVTGDLNVLLSGTSAGCARFNPLLNGLWLWLKSDEENVIMWHLQGLSSLLFVSAHQCRVALWVMQTSRQRNNGRFNLWFCCIDFDHFFITFLRKFHPCYISSAHADTLACRKMATFCSFGLKLLVITAQWVSGLWGPMTPLGLCLSGNPSMLTILQLQCMGILVSLIL